MVLITSVMITLTTTIIAMYMGIVTEAAEALAVLHIIEVVKQNAVGDSSTSASSTGERKGYN